MRDMAWNTLGQRDGVSPIHANCQGQAGEGSEYPGLAEAVPADCTGLD